MSESNRQLFALAAGDPARFEAALASVTASADALLEALVAGLPEVDKRLLDHPRLRAAYRESLALALQQGPQAMLAEFALLTRPWDCDLAAIRCPVTIWHGLADQNVPPAMGAALAAKISGARLNLVADAGHLLLWERCDEVLASAVQQC